jgi:hypothetical protein
LVEPHVANVIVAGSSPVSRSIFWRLSQVVRRRSAKPLFSGSNPEAALFFCTFFILSCVNKISYSKSRQAAGNIFDCRSAAAEPEKIFERLKKILVEFKTKSTYFR